MREPYDCIKCNDTGLVSVHDTTGNLFSHPAACECAAGAKKKAEWARRHRKRCIGQVRDALQAILAHEGALLVLGRILQEIGETDEEELFCSLSDLAQFTALLYVADRYDLKDIIDAPDDERAEDEPVTHHLRLALPSEDEGTDVCSEQEAAAIGTVVAMIPKGLSLVARW